jgi:DNA-binding NarL/FixJ family response regulator
MEAGNLGADFAGRPDDELHAAIDDLERWQKRQIARFARDGLSIPEIGARLFLSPRTVEWHLRKVFTKLEIRSRHELSAAFPSTESELAPA